MFLRTVKALLLAALLLLPALTGWLVKENSAPYQGPGSNVFFEVQKGRSVRSVIGNLGARSVIRSSLALTLAYRLFYSRQRLKAGEYEFTFPASGKDVLFKIFRGRIYLHPVTVPEGLTGDEIAGVLAAQAGVEPGPFRSAFRQTAPVAEWDARAVNLEGYLFPDTYLVPRNVTAGEFVDVMVGEFRKVFHEGWRKRAAELGLSVRDIVILASLIEKETGLPGERPLVSAVFHNRLRLGMKLDCDPTVIYGLKLEDKYSGRLLTRDLAFPSAYNTYIHSGLPPGPICNPGRQALDAALYPAPESYLYFVAQGDGSHHFSRSFAEHRQAVQRYQLKKN
ncbi:MAG: endolytic transglycosylase MltG [Candidatus Aminicenantales bacterium]